MSVINCHEFYYPDMSIENFHDALCIEYEDSLGYQVGYLINVTDFGTLADYTFSQLLDCFRQVLLKREQTEGYSFKSYSLKKEEVAKYVEEFLSQVTHIRIYPVSGLYKQDTIKIVTKTKGQIEMSVADIEVKLGVASGTLRIKKDN